jgi:ankyrin repeat domain-containing protein 50
VAIPTAFDNGLPDSDDLQAFFVNQITATKSCFIVVDGIDECAAAERNVLFTALRQVVQHSPRHFKIFIASRPQVGLEVGRFFKSYYHKSMDSPEVHADIARYIKMVLGEKRDNGDLQVGNPELVVEIEDTLVNSAHGM